MWTLVGARIARFWIVRLESVHLPVGTHDRHADGLPNDDPNLFAGQAAGMRGQARGARPSAQERAAGARLALFTRE
ncbi:hypothetical protein CRG98_010010 [Punica granatum]|uniref:Uncharacterized protein n=1 Tax=Punica granatum TaxID=22663 RepID=A0A2I0KM75_PUNGR|nr:hypothetical protein CRG98_010010 [Punica granatum]